jgi:hypothetical protein
MDPLLQVALVAAALGGLLASWSIIRRWRRPPESPFAGSTEGSKRCPSCGMGNLWTDRECISCGAELSE